jgi:hypothetical protein
MRDERTEELDVVVIGLGAVYFATLLVLIALLAMR